MLYYLHEMSRLSMAPARAMTEGLRAVLANPFNPFSGTPMGRSMASAAEIFEHLTRSYGKPAWGLNETVIDGEPVAVEEEIIIKRTYCHLLHFKRAAERKDPKLLVVAPLSGHYATLLRGTVETMLPDHDVYVTDWLDCRMIPVTMDRFNLNDYIDYLIDFLHLLGPNTHMLAVCQPSVPAMAAVSVMSGWGDNCVPATLTMIGGPIDTRKSPTQVNKLAEEHPLEWFEQNVVTDVPPPYPGMFRKVYPGFIQLTNFIAMNYERHLESYNELFDHLVQGDDEAADKKRSFYEEYRAVMDLPAEFYLQTLKTVFQDHALPKGEMIARWHPVLPEYITRTALMCIEGELDDISGVGQTKAALEITPNLPDDMKHYHLQLGVGHYGVFNGRKWREELAPRIKRFIRTHDHEIGRGPGPKVVPLQSWRGPDRRSGPRDGKRGGDGAASPGSR
ncbi:MAG: polyhydroxyalkanoate depolymerase [Alphaproteobacteria bacterium]